MNLMVFYCVSCKLALGGYWWCLGDGDIIPTTRGIDQVRNSITLSTLSISSHVSYQWTCIPYL